MTYQLITIVGNIGRDSEFKYLKDGTGLVNFSIAVNKTTGSGENRKKTTTWFKCVLFGNRAEGVEKFLKKGAEVLVTGEVSASAWIDKKSGEAMTGLELRANDVKVIKFVETNDGGGKSSGRSSRYADNERADDLYDEFPDEMPF